MLLYHRQLEVDYQNDKPGSVCRSGIKNRLKLIDDITNEFGILFCYVFATVFRIDP